LETLLDIDLEYLVFDLSCSPSQEKEAEDLAGLEDQFRVAGPVFCDEAEQLRRMRELNLSILWDLFPSEPRNSDPV
jgi:hypothetical protein